MLDQAFEALKTYDWGSDLKPLAPITAAVTDTRQDEAARKDLESRLAAVLKTDASRAAKDFVCRKLMIVGTAASVPALAALLPDKDLSHMARYALERIPGPEASQALRDSLSTVTGEQKIGVVSSLGVRRDTASIPSLTAMVADSDPAVARAAAIALGDIGGGNAAKALASATSEAPEVVSAVVDARLTCAEELLDAGKRADALVIYKSLAGENQPKHIRLAATRGMLACAATNQ